MCLCKLQQVRQICLTAVSGLCSSTALVRSHLHFRATSQLKLTGTQGQCCTRPSSSASRLWLSPVESAPDLSELRPLATCTSTVRPWSPLFWMPGSGAHCTCGDGWCGFVAVKDPAWLRWTRRRWLWSPAAICAAMACEQVLSSILQSYTLPLQEEEQEASRRITAYHGVSRSLLWQSAVWHLTPSQAARQAKDSAGPTRNEPRRKVKHRGFTCMQVMRALSLTATTSLSFFR